MDTNELREWAQALKDTQYQVAADGLTEAARLFDELTARMTALEAASAPLPVASWLESLVATISQFALDKQGEWAGVDIEHIPDHLNAYRPLQDELDELADEIAAATAPTPAAETPAPAQEPVRVVPVYPTHVEYAMHGLIEMVSNPDMMTTERLRAVLEWLQKASTDAPAVVPAQKPLVAGKVRLFESGEGYLHLFAGTWMCADLIAQLGKLPADVRIVISPAGGDDETAVQS